MAPRSDAVTSPPRCPRLQTRPPVFGAETVGRAAFNPFDILARWALSRDPERPRALLRYQAMVMLVRGAGLRVSETAVWAPRKSKRGSTLAPCLCPFQMPSRVG